MSYLSLNNYTSFYLPQLKPFLQFPNTPSLPFEETLINTPGNYSIKAWLNIIKPSPFTFAFACSCTFAFINADSNINS